MNAEPSIEGQYHTMMVIWASLFMSQVLFLVLVYFTRPQLFRFDFARPFLGESGRGSGSTAALIIGFAVAAVTAVLFSFAFKRRLNERAAAEQNTAQVQTGFVIALALCEAASLFGLTLAFAFDYPYFYAWLALGIVGMILHFPKRDPLHAASMKKTVP